jgi:hypothetical protein
MVKISGMIPLWDTALESYQFVPLSLHMPKRTVKILVETNGFKTLAEQIVLFLLVLSSVGLPSRKKNLSIPIPIDQFPRVRVILLREDAATFKKFFKQEPDPKKTNEDFLYESIRIFLLPARILETIVHPPRGRASSVFELDQEISGALFACHKLVINGNRAIQHRITEIFEEMISEDKEFLNYLIKFGKHNITDETMDATDLIIDNITENIPQSLLQQFIIIGLVHRAFKGAWEKHGHAGLLQDHPLDTFRKYLYGKRSESIAYHTKLCEEKFPDLYQGILETSKRYYLSDPGAAVKKTFKSSF